MKKVPCEIIKFSENITYLIFFDGSKMIYYADDPAKLIVARDSKSIAYLFMEEIDKQEPCGDTIPDLIRGIDKDDYWITPLSTELISDTVFTMIVCLKDIEQQTIYGLVNVLVEIQPEDFDTKREMGEKLKATVIDYYTANEENWNKLNDPLYSISNMLEIIELRFMKG